MLSPGIVLQRRYRIKRLLARGGMGAVYEAEAVHLGNATVAVKETFFSEDWLQEQFQREAATMARLRHQALPKVTDHFSEGEGQFLVMEFIAGDDLGALLEQRLKVKGEPFEFRQVMEWADRLLDALAYIHGQYPPVIHRDIKPQNLKLTPRGELFLIDFGLSKDATTPTRPGYSLHAYTLEFAPPEQIKGEGTDARSDLYSLGATLYHLATGKTPPDARIRLESVVKHLMPDLLQPAHHVNPRIPFAFSAALAKAMALDRQQRYQSAQEMREALRQIERAIEAEIAERERREEDHRRLEEEARRREEERKRLEEEARLREIERQRQIEEAERLKALQEEIRKKEEELAKLKQTPLHEAVTVPIVRASDKVGTEPVVVRPDAGERRIDREEEGKRREEETRQREIERQRKLEEAERLQALWELGRKNEELRKLKQPLPHKEESRSHKTRSLTSIVLLIAGAVLVVAIVVAYLIWQRQTTPEQKTQSAPSPASSNEPSSAQRAFSFETVTLDRTGRETSRKSGQARYFVVELGNGVTLEMVEIPGGSFTMGSPATEAERESDEGPRHRVSVPSFWMGKFEVTQKQWKAVMGGNPSSFIGDDLPVENVSWNDAQEFLAALNWKLGLQDKDRQYQYRLPSEAEWEYAARGGTDTPVAFGETITPQIVNYDGNFPYASAPKGTYRQKTVAVGSLGVADAFGLFDMHGNVWEWCEDVYHNDYNGAPTDGSAWLSGGDSNIRVLRGGSWFYSGRNCRAANRYRLGLGDRDNHNGFRVVVSARTL